MEDVAILTLVFMTQAESSLLHYNRLLGSYINCNQMEIFATPLIVGEVD